MPRERRNPGALARGNGYYLLNIRAWYEADDGEMKPGKSGFALRLDLLPIFSDATVGEARTRQQEDHPRGA